MKKAALIVALMLVAGGASAQSWTTSDNTCLSVGAMAAATARARESGVTESRLLVVLRSIKGGATPAEKHGDAVAELLVPFVYTMKLKPEDARQIVYLKCKAGEYPAVK